MTLHIAYVERIKEEVQPRAKQLDLWALGLESVGVDNADTRIHNILCLTQLPTQHIRYSAFPQSCAAPCYLVLCLAKAGSNPAGVSRKDDKAAGRYWARLYRLYVFRVDQTRHIAGIQMLGVSFGPDTDMFSGVTR